MKTIILYLIAITAPVLADELVPSQIPPSAKWLLHLDMDALRDSGTGKAIFARIEAEQGVKLQALKRITSVHLLNDIHDLTLYGDGKPEHAVALISGKFDEAHLVDLLKAADNYSEENHAGVTIRSWKDKGKSQHAAFASDRLLVFSRQDDALKQELDALNANAPGTSDPIFAVSGGKSLIVAIANLGEIELPADASKIIRLASVLRISATENNGRFSIHMGTETRNPKNADRLRRMLDGMLALAEAGNPKLGEVDFRYEIGSTQEKPGVNVTLSLPVPAWLEMMNDAGKKKDEHHD